jgi:hypothetical protein
MMRGQSAQVAWFVGGISAHGLWNSAAAQSRQAEFAFFGFRCQVSGQFGFFRYYHFVIPGLTRNTVSFYDVTELDAGSGPA